MNIKEMNEWKKLILKAPKVEIVDDGWTLHVGGWQSRATIPLTKIDGVQGHCAVFWRKYPEEDEKLEFIFWGKNICGCSLSQIFKYENEPDVDVFLKKLIDEILPNLKLNLEGKLGIPDGADDILCEINDIFETLEIPKGFRVEWMGKFNASRNNFECTEIEISGKKIQLATNLFSTTSANPVPQIGIPEMKFSVPSIGSTTR